MSEREPRRDGTLDERLAYWEERLADAESLGRPRHIEVVKRRVETLLFLVAQGEARSV